MNRRERRFTFDAVAARYAATRPGYPRDVFATIAKAAPGRRLLEIGAGTGKATEGFVARGLEVTAVEPGAAMIAESRKLPALGAVRFECGTFEGWTPPAGWRWDVVAAAQAWHWVDPEIGYGKAADLLDAGGVLAIFGNYAPFPEGNLKALVNDAYRRVAPELIDPAGFGLPWSYYTAEGPIADQIRASGRFEEPREHSFSWSESYRTAPYLEMISTHSDHQLLGESRLARLLEALGETIEAQGGVVHLAYRTHLVLARRAD